MFPELAYKAILSNPNEIIKFLNKSPDINVSGKELVTYDWGLQLLLIKHSDNSIAKMIYNDLSKLYHKHCSVYFDNEFATSMSINYYNSLKQAIIEDVESTKIIIQKTMEESAALWSNQ